MLSRVLHRPAQLEVAPRAQLKQAFMSLGFSAAAAASYARMTAVCMDNRFQQADNSPTKGTTTLESCFRDVVTEIRQRRSA